MILKTALFFCLVSNFVLASVTPNEIATRCQVKPLDQLYSSDFRWDYSLAELIHRFFEIYNSPRQLPKKAYWDPKTQKIKLPYEPSRGGDVEISENFVRSISRHIEKAFELDVIDGVFFPDMGHSHLLIPESLFKRKYAQFSNANFKGFYETAFKDPELRILYHTAEQLKLLDDEGQLINDPRIQHRFRTRNIVGFNHPRSELQFYNNPNSRYNTVQAVPGYHWWSAGFNISGNEKGCFSYQHRGQTYYFDLSLYDLEPEI